MPETVFWDTAAFVAPGNTRDDLHQVAMNVNRELAQAEAQVLTMSQLMIKYLHLKVRMGYV